MRYWQHVRTIRKLARRFRRLVRGKDRVHRLIGKHGRYETAREWRHAVRKTMQAGRRRGRAR